MIRCISSKRARKLKKRGVHVWWSWFHDSLVWNNGQNTPAPEKKTIHIKGFVFEETCKQCPEQYDVLLNGAKVAYVRLRDGVLRVDIPDCGFNTIFEDDLPSQDSDIIGGEFENDDIRQRWLNFIAGELLKYYSVGDQS